MNNEKGGFEASSESVSLHGAIQGSYEDQVCSERWTLMGGIDHLNTPDGLGALIDLRKTLVAWHDDMALEELKRSLSDYHSNCLKSPPNQVASWPAANPRCAAA